MNKENSESEAGKGQTPKTKRELLKEKVFHLFGKTYIALPTLVLVLLWVGTTSYYLTQIYQVDPLENKLSESEGEIEELSSQNQSLTADLEKLRKESTVIASNEKIPVPIAPIRKKAVIGRMVKFQWDYKGGVGFTNYVLEIQPTGSRNTQPLRYHVPDPGRETLYFELNPKWVGQMFWRVRPGGLPDGADQSRLWSYYGSFVVYRSILHRIRTTGKLIVGTTPAFLSYDHPIHDRTGRPDSFDIDLVYWLGEKLKEKLKIPDLEVELRNIQWEKLFERVRTYEVDIAIGTITKSKQRESAFPGLRFSNGYLQNHQILIEGMYSRGRGERSMRGGEFLTILKGKKVGVQNHTINEKAARALAKQYDFEVEDNFGSYVDVYDALRQGKIDFGMIDSVRHEMVRNPEFQQVGGHLDDYLTNFYKKELGQSVEEFAIAVAEAIGAERGLLRLVNEILASPEAKGKGEKLEELKEKFFGRVEE